MTARRAQEPSTPREALQAFTAYLRTGGHTLTRSRRLIAETLIRARGHLAAEDIVERLRRSGTPVSGATVYRTLQLMRASGCFDAHDFDQGRRLYEPMVGRAHHDHLYCITCGRVIEFSEEQIERLQDQIVRRHCFTAVYHSHKIFGYCRRCTPHAPAGSRHA